MKTLFKYCKFVPVVLSLMALTSGLVYAQQAPIEINNHAHCTNDYDGKVELEFNYPGAVQMKVSNHPEFRGAHWESYTETKKWKLAGHKDGKKVVYVRFKDAGENESDIYKSHIVYDTQAPQPGKIQINDGETTTLYSDVLLKFTAKEAELMWISNHKKFATGQWESYTDTKKWLLIEGDGQRTIYVKYKDSCGNISRVISKSITVSYN